MREELYYLKRRARKKIEIIADEWKDNKTRVIAQVLVPLYTAYSYSQTRDKSVFGSHGDVIDEWGKRWAWDLTKAVAWGYLGYKIIN